MKKSIYQNILNFLKVLGFCFFSFAINIFSQDMKKDTPYTLNNDFKGKIKAIKDLNTITFPDLNLDSLNEIDKKYYGDGKGHPFRFGIPINDRFNVQDNFTKDTISEKVSLYRLKIKCNNAFSINLVFDNLYFSDSSNICLFDPNGKNLSGPFTNKDIKSRK